MDKTITTALLIVISMVMSLALFNAAYPAIIQGGDAINSMTNRSDERMRSQAAIIHAASEQDASGQWQDTNGNGQPEVFVWVKNIGSTSITALERTDVFFGKEGSFARIPHQSEANGSFPYWTAQVENSDDWRPTATLKITIHLQSAPGQGRYFIKITIPSGVSDEYFLSI
ncbi:MAG: hypothetical protein IT324_03215 [Anaerolineae bacterium]|nr:hypothetical protein [Anaerolineae bacterium]